MVDARLVGHHLTVSWLYIRHRKPLRVLCKGKTSAFHGSVLSFTQYRDVANSFI